MKVLVTGSAGHLGEALMRTLESMDHDVTGIDIRPSIYTHRIGSITDPDFVRDCMRGVDIVFHTASLHKPHIVTHSRQMFVDANISGTLNLLEESVIAQVRAFVFSSTTSVYGHALTPKPGDPAAWITESIKPVTKNVYGVTKLAAEDLCEMFHYRYGLPSIVLRCSRFFLEDDDDVDMRRLFDTDNLKVNEFLYRRVDMEDVVSAHILAASKAPTVGFARYIVSATSPFTCDDLMALRTDPASVVRRYVSCYESEYARRGWRMLPQIERVYVNERARLELGWQPRFDFAHVVSRLKEKMDYQSQLARLVGVKGYHITPFRDGPYPVEPPDELRLANARVGRQSHSTPPKKGGFIRQQSSSVPGTAFSEKRSDAA